MTSNSILTRIGARMYVFDTNSDSDDAREIWAYWGGTQEGFEDELRRERIQFVIDSDHS